MGKEIVSLFVGQAGVQIGNSFWEQLTAEYGISPNGELQCNTYIKQEQEYNLFLDDNSTAFFYCSPLGNWVPRSLMIDLEPTVVDEIRCGMYKNLFNPQCLISGKEDAANVFSRAYHGLGRTTILEPTLENFRQQIEGCDAIQSILLFHSINGGTGSGFTSLFYDEIAEQYKKIPKMDITLAPSKLLAQNNVEPYNCSLGFHYYSPHCDICFTYDNAALYNICLNNLDIKNPKYNTINRILSQVFSSLTAPFRYGCVLTGGINEFMMNLVPYPRIHYVVSTFAPLINQTKFDHTLRNINTFTRDVFSQHNQLVDIDITAEKFMSCSLIYRGAVNAKMAYDALQNVKSKRFQFVDWCPTGFKVSICKQCPTYIKQSHIATSDINVMLMTNTPAISDIFQRTIEKFEHLYSKRAFVHWFVSEGMEEGEFMESTENLKSLINDYKLCADENNKDDDKKKNQQQQQQQQQNNIAAQTQTQQQEQFSLSNSTSIDAEHMERKLLPIPQNHDEQDEKEIQQQQQDEQYEKINNTSFNNINDDDDIQWHINTPVSETSSLLNIDEYELQQNSLQDMFGNRKKAKVINHVDSRLLVQSDILSSNNNLPNDDISYVTISPNSSLDALRNEQQLVYATCCSHNSSE